MRLTTSQAETILNNAIPAHAGLGNMVAYADKVAEAFHQYCAKPNWDKPDDEDTITAHQRIVKYVKKAMTVTAPSVADDPVTARKEYLSIVACRLAKIFDEEIVKDETLN